MSIKSDKIKGKLVDYQVVDSVNNIDNENQGQINVIVKDNDDNGIYVGDNHIASGYGFKSESQRVAIEELFSNENFKKLLNGTLFNNQQNQSSDKEENNDEETDENVYETLLDNLHTGSEINFHGDILSLYNGILYGKHWIDIIKDNIEINITEILNGDSTSYTLHLNDIFETSMFSNIYIDKLSIKYSVLDPSISLYYKLYYEYTDSFDSPEFNRSNLIQIENINTFGEIRNLTLTLRDDTYFRKIKKETSSIISITPVYLYITDYNQTHYTSIKLFDIKYKYPIYEASSSEVFNVNEYNFLNTNNYKLYEENGCEININTDANEPSKNYFIVPTVLKNPQFIFKNSNINCNFKFKENYSLSNKGLGDEYNVVYKVYESPKKYSSDMTWIVK